MEQPLRAVHRIRLRQRGPIMTAQLQPHRTRGHRPGYQPTTLADITIRIHATPDVDAEVWHDLNTDVDAAIDSTLKKYGLAGVRTAVASER